MALAASPINPFLALLSVFSLLFFLKVYAGVDLDKSDLEALKIIQKDLGIVPGQLNCNTPGVICERRISGNNTYVLRATRLIFKSQNLRGSISPAVGLLSELKELSLSNNQLVNRLPSQLTNCKKLEILNLKNNRFSGKIPPELSSLVRLRVLDLAFNRFSGDLSFLKYFPNMERLSVADNLFTGKIPAAIRSFRNLQFFDIAGNSFLEGPVPTLNRVEQTDIALPKRYVFAEVPSKRTNASAPITSSRSPSNQPSAPAPGPANAETHKKNQIKKIIGWILGFTTGAIVGSLSGFVFSLLFKLILAAIRGIGKDSGLVIFSREIKKEQLAFLSKDEDLASLEIIGRGGCGEVYKAELQGIKIKTVAIKKIIQPPKDAAELTDEDSKLLNKKMRQIRSEIQTVGQIRHRNLLPLLAHVSRPECHYLIYEFMKNGSLQDLLQRVSEGTQELDWPARHKIAMGVAEGLEYLHMHHSQRIIHRDLKPANILLDDDMEARIADFGLAKAVPDAHTHVTSSNVVGTLGYIAPEYHQTLKFTEKSDVYSFGVLLAALLMGKLPSDEFFQHTPEMSLVKWLRNVIMTSEYSHQAIDPKLIGTGYEEQILLVLKIAYFCTLDEAKQRPNSKEVRCMLSQIRP